MATETQISFVADIEAAVAARIMDRQPPHKAKMNEISEMAGREVHNIRPLIMRLAELGEIDLLKRLQTAFGKVGIKHNLLESQLARLTRQSNEPAADVLTLEQKLPPSEKSSQATAKGPQPFDDIAIQGQVLRILQPLPKSIQAKVINSAAVFLGVGE